MHFFKSKAHLIFLNAFIIFALSACGGGGASSDPTDTLKEKENAIEKIMAFADGGKSPPTLQDYINAGVTGVTSETLAKLNTIISGLSADDVDTKEEIEALTSQLGINIVPTANAGGNKTVQVNTSVTITGSGTDSDGNIASYKWQKGGTVLATNASFNYAPTTIGTDTLTLTVTDNDGDSASDSIVVVVSKGPAPLNQAPTANAGANKTVQVNKSITITGIGTDSDGTISFVWKKGSTTLATTASFNYTPTKVGTDTLTLIVTDDDGDSASDTMKVIVSTTSSSNKAPTANAGSDKTVQVNKSIVITGSGTDSDGTISYVWKKGSKVLANKASFTYTPTKSGTDILTLTVTDNDGAFATDTMNVVVSVAPVSDTTPPVITLLGDNPASVVHESQYTDAGATASDNHDGNITAAIIVTGDTVNTNAAVGTIFTIKYNVMDAAKNPATQVTRTVTIITQSPDTTDPVITLKGASPLEIFENSSYIDAGATALDDRDGNITANIIVGGDTVDTSLPLGSTFIITYNVKDAAQNPAIEITRSVSIIEDPNGDHTIPVLSEADKQNYLNTINSARAQARTCSDTGNFPAVPAVIWSDQLYKAAYEHSQDMTVSDTFSHSGSGTASDWSGFALNKQSSMTDRVATYNYNWSRLSENISAGTNRDTAEEAMDSWLNSSGHCHNIMNADVTEVGMALSSSQSAYYTNYWTQNFGKPQ